MDLGLDLGLTINTNDNQCVEDDKYSFTKCLKKYVTEKSNCTINFFERESNRKSFCTKDSFAKYTQLLQDVKQKPILEINKESGCYAKCRTIHYSYEKNLKKVFGETKWDAEVYIQPKSSVVEYFTEYYSFDVNDLISNVGGNLGLFLGWSILTLMEAHTFVFVIYNYLRKR